MWPVTPCESNFDTITTSLGTVETRKMLREVMTTSERPQCFDLKPMIQAFRDYEKERYVTKKKISGSSHISQ